MSLDGKMPNVGGRPFGIVMHDFLMELVLFNSKEKVTGSKKEVRVTGSKNKVVVVEVVV